MLKSEILVMTRGLCDDEVVPYRTSDAEFSRFLNDAQYEACRRANLITAYPNIVSITGSCVFAATAKTITKATGGFLLSASATSEVDHFEVGDEITISGTTTNDGVKTIVSVTDTVIVVSETLVNGTFAATTILATRTVTRLPLRTGVSTYRLHPKILGVIRARPDSLTYPLVQKTLGGLDAGSAFIPDGYGGFYTQSWEDVEDNMFSYLEDHGLIRVISPPAEDDILWMVTYRLPKYDFIASGDESVSPEIPVIYHAGLVDWMLHLNYSKPDSEIRDLDRAREYENSFEKKFGTRPSALTETNRKKMPNNMSIRNRQLGF